MRYFILFSFFLLIIGNAQDVEIKNIDEKIAKIDAPRVGITLETLNNTKNPFLKEAVAIEGAVVLQQVEKISLKGIMNNKAYINDAWVGLNDEVEGYSVVSITPNRVLLKREDRTKELFLRDKKSSFIKIEAR